MMEENDEMIFFKDLYAGRLVDFKILKDGNSRIKNRFIILKKTNKKIGGVGYKPYYLYKRIYHSDSFYINDQGKVISKYRDDDVVESKMEIIDFYSVKEIFNKALYYIESPEKYITSKDYVDFILKYVDEENFIEVNDELIQDLLNNLEYLHSTLYEIIEKHIVDNHDICHSGLSQKAGKVIEFNTFKNKRDLDQIKSEDSRKLT